jgi:hypothetical protein
MDLPHLPRHPRDDTATTIGDKLSNWNGGTGTVDLQGGDAETRPLNAYVLYYIKYRDA